MNKRIALTLEFKSLFRMQSNSAQVKKHVMDANQNKKKILSGILQISDTMGL